MKTKIISRKRLLKPIVLIFTLLFAGVGTYLILNSRAAVIVTNSLPGDTNNDRIVNLADLSTLLSHYSTNYPAADFNKDLIVNLTDLSILLTNWGNTSTPPTQTTNQILGFNTLRSDVSDDFTGTQGSKRTQHVGVLRILEQPTDQSYIGTD